MPTAQRLEAGAQAVEPGLHPRDLLGRGALAAEAELAEEPGQAARAGAFGLDRGLLFLGRTLALGAGLLEQLLELGAYALAVLLGNRLAGGHLLRIQRRECLLHVRQRDVAVGVAHREVAQLARDRLALLVLFAAGFYVGERLVGKGVNILFVPLFLGPFGLRLVLLGDGVAGAEVEAAVAARLHQRPEAVLLADVRVERQGDVADDLVVAPAAGREHRPHADGDVLNGPVHDFSCGALVRDVEDAVELAVGYFEGLHPAGVVGGMVGVVVRDPGLDAGGPGIVHPVAQALERDVDRLSRVVGEDVAAHADYLLAKARLGLERPLAVGLLVFFFGLLPSDVGALLLRGLVGFALGGQAGEVGLAQELVELGGRLRAGLGRCEFLLVGHIKPLQFY